MLAYSEVRGLAHVVRPAPYVLPQLHLERYLFHGTVPTVQLQHWLWHGTLQWYDQVLLDVMKIHSVVPAALAFVLWLNRRALFYRFAATMISLSFSAAVIFWIFPAAPPWDAGLLGFLHVTKITHGASVALPTQYTLNHFIDGNPNAAVPSLHAGYAFLVFLFVVTLAWRTRWRWLALGAGVLYPALQSFAVVYTGNHYVVDLLLGYLFATGAFLGVRWFWRRLAFPF
jgi:membrane-associated phospholipid phosphatase